METGDRKCDEGPEPAFLAGAGAVKKGAAPAPAPAPALNLCLKKRNKLNFLTIM